MIRRPPSSTQSRASAASDVYKRQARRQRGEPETDRAHGRQDDRQQRQGGQDGRGGGAPGAHRDQDERHAHREERERGDPRREQLAEDDLGSRERGDLEGGERPGGTVTVDRGGAQRRRDEQAE